MLMLMLALWFAAAAPAGQAAPMAAVPSRPEVLPLTGEINLALSAAPDHLKAGAGVWALEAQRLREDSRHDQPLHVHRQSRPPLNRQADAATTRKAPRRSVRRSCSSATS